MKPNGKWFGEKTSPNKLLFADDTHTDILSSPPLKA